MFQKTSMTQFNCETAWKMIKRNVRMPGLILNWFLLYDKWKCDFIQWNHRKKNFRQDKNSSKENTLGFCIRFRRLKHKKSKILEFFKCLVYYSSRMKNLKILAWKNFANPRFEKILQDKFSRIDSFHFFFQNQFNESLWILNSK